MTQRFRRHGSSGRHVPLLLFTSIMAAALCACPTFCISNSTAASTNSAAKTTRRESFLLGLLPLSFAQQAAMAKGSQLDGKRIVVLGGSGFVGQRVCEQLVGKGASVTSVSRSGKPPAASGSWVSQVRWEQGDVLSYDLASMLQGAEGVVSAIGAIGSSDDARGNGATNEAAAAAAAKAGVKQFVLISASQDVAAAGVDAIFGAYIEGKRRAEKAVITSFPGRNCILQPSFIYGGDEFSATPPRVASWYGGKVEGLLGSDLFRAMAAASPAALRLALSPPLSVDDVAAAAVAGVDGQIQGVLPNHDSIVDAARLSRSG
eukprot:TRINITY_DN64142_c0_g1_i1.p1 TRINITY_DN64142_c0_g1~~TRINITY_DN64142_c0_g1_i1.p1  ORF type:complete len:329 (+),score=65.24 TRINITY_DN64142_c0_g1_i1:34-987(+)